jgi:spore coat protein U-like protein
MIRRPHDALSLAWSVGWAVLLAAVSQASLAATSCTFTSVSSVSFGTYDIFAGSPNSNGVGGLTIDCKGAGNHTFVLTLGTGQSNSYSSRLMMSGVNRLDYNLYTGAERSVVWGDGTGVSRVVTVNKNKPTTVSIFGLIPAGQDAVVGVYTDSIIATVNF